MYKLGRGTLHDDVAELSGASAETHRVCFIKFITFFAENVKDKYINYPTGEYLECVLDQFKKVGFPGAIGSMDGTHIKWLRCPYGKLYILIHF